MLHKITHLLLLVFALLLLTPPAARAQSWQWARENTAGSSATYGNQAPAVTTDAFGHEYVVGAFSDSITFGGFTVYSSYVGATSIYFAKYDTLGNVLWLKSMGGAFTTGVSSLTDEPTAISTDNAGNIYITGFSADTSISFGALTLNKCPACSEVGMFLVKYNTGGNAIWARIAGGKGSIAGNAVRVSNANTVYLTGIGSDSLVLGSVAVTDTYTHSAFIAAYDTAGNALWAKTYGGSDSLYNIMEADDSGNVVLFGATHSSVLHFGSVSLPIIGSGGHQHLFFAKYDALGNLLWTKSAGGDSSENIYDMTTDANGNIYFLGYASSPDDYGGSITFDTTTYNRVVGFFGKYNGNGNFEWLKYSHSLRFYAITHDATRNLYVTGTYSPFTGIGSTYLLNGTDSILIDTPYFSSPLPAFNIIKFDTSGNIIWKLESPYSDLMGDIAIFTSIHVGNFGSLFLTGFHFTGACGTCTTGDYIYFGSIELIHPDTLDGLAFFAMMDTAYSLNIAKPKTSEANSTLFPNPASHILTIASQNFIDNIIIYNILGEVVYNCKFDKKQARIDVSMLINGMYYVKINGTEVLKFLKE